MILLFSHAVCCETLRKGAKNTSHRRAFFSFLTVEQHSKVRMLLNDENVVVVLTAAFVMTK